MITSLLSRPCEQLSDPEVKLRFNALHRPQGKIKLSLAEKLLRDVAETKGVALPIEDDAYRSVYRPEMLDVPMHRFLSQKVWKPKMFKLVTAVERVRKKLHLADLDPISPEESYQLLLRDKDNRQAGLPFLLKKGEDFGALERARQCLRGKCPPPAVILHRGKNTEIVRPVWCLPFEWHIVEAMFFYPLQDYMMAEVRTYASDKAINRRAQILSYVSSEESKCKISLDFSGYDASISTHLIKLAFDLLWQGFVKHPEYAKLWERIRTFFCYITFFNAGW